MNRTATAESHLSWDHCHLLDIDSLCVCVCALRNYQCEPLRVASWINDVVGMLKEEGIDSFSSDDCDLKTQPRHI